LPQKRPRMSACAIHRIDDLLYRPVQRQANKTEGHGRPTRSSTSSVRAGLGRWAFAAKKVSSGRHSAWPDVQRTALGEGHHGRPRKDFAGRVSAHPIGRRPRHLEPVFSIQPPSTGPMAERGRRRVCPPSRRSSNTYRAAAVARVATDLGAGERLRSENRVAQAPTPAAVTGRDHSLGRHAVSGFENATFMTRQPATSGAGARFGDDGVAGGSRNCPRSRRIRGRGKKSGAEDAATTRTTVRQKGQAAVSREGGCAGPSRRFARNGQPARPPAEQADEQQCAPRANPGRRRFQRVGEHAMA